MTRNGDAVWVEMTMTSTQPIDSSGKINEVLRRKALNMQCLDLATGENDAEFYDVRCAFDEINQEWLYSISMPQRDKDVLDEICRSNRIGIEDLVPLFFQWTIREPEKAIDWLIGKEEKKVELWDVRRISKSKTYRHFESLRKKTP